MKKQRWSMERKVEDPSELHYDWVFGQDFFNWSSALCHHSVITQQEFSGLF